VVGYADPRSLVTSYVRNGFGEVIRETSPDAGVTTYTRDLRGLVTQMTDGRGVVSNMSYDNAGRLLTVAYPAAVAENVTYSYDLATSSRGKLAKIVDQSGSTEFTYNNLGQITTDKRTVGTKIYTTSYTYDTADHITKITYPSGRTVSYAYNSLGQLITASTKLNGAAANQNIATTVTYVPMANLMTGFTHGNGLKTTATYDLDYRLTSLAVKNGTAFVSNLGYAYADGMNLTAINDNVAVANNIALFYNPANRLQNASGSWGQSVSYYDGVGNRTYDNTTVGAVTTTRASIFPSNSNRISGMTENGAALRTYTYDGGGNIITDVRPGESFAFTYNKRNRPVSVTRNAVAYASYGYNAFEQLVTRSTSAVGGPVGTIHYIYDLDGHLIAEADAITGTTTREYIWAAANDNTPIDLPLAVIDGVNTATPATLWVHTDHLGRPTRMTDATKATVWAAAYKAWGEPTLLSGTKLLNLRFPGQVFQIETGLAYNWNRHYDTTTGRYTQPDPLRFVDGPAIYAYAGNSPFMETDPSGECLWDGCVVEAAVAGAVVGVFIEYVLNGECATASDYIVAALGGAAGSVVGRFAYLPWKFAGRWMNFSHSLPARWFRPSSKYFKPWLPKWLNGPLNGSLGTGLRHFKHDSAVFGAPASWGGKWPRVVQVFDRIPDWIKGSIVGGGAGSAYDGSSP
jgi:RHS repeat-associated protein